MSTPLQALKHAMGTWDHALANAGRVLSTLVLMREGSEHVHFLLASKVTTDIVAAANTNRALTLRMPDPEQELHPAMAEAMRQLGAYAAMIVMQATTTDGEECLVGYLWHFAEEFEAKWCRYVVDGRPGGTVHMDDAVLPFEWVKACG